MATNEELIAAVKMLKEECSKFPHCTGCPLVDKQGVCFCRSVELGSPVVPCNWRLPTSRRFTNEEISLVKALKAFGVKTIGKSKTLNNCFYVVKDGGKFLLPKSAFDSVKLGEAVSIDEILKEEEQ